MKRAKTGSRVLEMRWAGADMAAFSDYATGLDESVNPEKTQDTLC